MDYQEQLPIHRLKFDLNRQVLHDIHADLVAAYNITPQSTYTLQFLSYFCDSFFVQPTRLPPAQVSITVIYHSRNDRSFRLLE